MYCASDKAKRNHNINMTSIESLAFQLKDSVAFFIVCSILVRNMRGVGQQPGHSLPRVVLWGLGLVRD